MDFSADRDRDAAGRARNARPRDALGRPLPYGAAGEERASEGVVRTPDDALAEAQALLDAGRPFHAHEVLEDAWNGRPASSSACASVSEASGVRTTPSGARSSPGTPYGSGRPSASRGRALRARPAASRSRSRSAEKSTTASSREACSAIVSVRGS